MELKYKNHQPGLILTTKQQIFAMLNVLYKSAIRSRHHKYTDTENQLIIGQKIQQQNPLWLMPLSKAFGQSTVLSLKMTFSWS